MRIPDVGGLRSAALEQSHDALDEIVHVAERPGLRAVAVHGEGLAAERLHDEVRHHATIMRSHARSVRVEDAYDASIEIMVAMIRHGHRFRESLGLVVHPARSDRIHVAPVALGLGMHQRITVHLRRRSQQEPRALRLRETERLMGAEGSDLEGLDRELQVVDRAGGAGEMEHAFEGPLHFDEVGDVVQDQLKAGMAFQMIEVRAIAGDEVVHPHHSVTEGEEAVAEVGAEEPRSAGYEDAHATGRPMLS